MYVDDDESIITGMDHNIEWQVARPPESSLTGSCDGEKKSAEIIKNKELIITYTDRRHSY